VADAGEFLLDGQRREIGIHRSTVLRYRRMKRATASLRFPSAWASARQMRTVLVGARRNLAAGGDDADLASTSFAITNQ
jgi:hypothetical protein